MGTNAGLCFYDDASNRFINIEAITASDTLCSKNISSILLDHSGLLWIGTNDGINIYDPRKNELKRFNPGDKIYASVKKEVLCMLEDHNGAIWISLLETHSGNSRIYRYLPATGYSKLYFHSVTDPHSLSIGPVNTMIEDSHNNIWGCMYEGGLWNYQPATDNFRNYRADPSDHIALNTNQIVGLLEDRSGVLWVCTNGGGLDNAYLTNTNFSVYQNYDKEFLSHYPLSLYKDHSGNIFLSTFGAGVHEFHPKTGDFTSYTFTDPHHEVTGFNFCYGMLEASDGNLWAVSFDEGLHKLDRKTGKFTTIHSTENTKNTGVHNQSNCIVKDGGERLWIGTNNGLKCYNLETKTFLGFEEIYHDTNQLSNDAIVSLYCDSKGILWIAGTKGLSLLNTITGSVKIFKHDETGTTSISSNAINCFYEPENTVGKVWIGTNGGGLNVFDRPSGQFTSYTTKDGLPDNSVMGILSDDVGNLWLSTNNGLCRFTPPSSGQGKATTRNYDMSDGLPSEEFYYNTSIKGADGSLYFGSNAGLVVFNPAELTNNMFVPLSKSPTLASSMNR